ncbi:MAG: 50S ribosomal protein L9 [Clostridiales bacterium]|jgi:ribosomal protein L9|nr:50S ribosomal protein L9 [Clostridiales bacterium]
MKVILLEDVKKLGKKDEIIEVSSGYARNFLIPNKKAIVADNVNLNKLEGKKSKESHIKELSLEHAKEIKKIIEKETLVIKAKKGKDDRLFGTITNSEISKELKKKYNVDIDRKKIIVENPIKIVGEYIITIKLEQGVMADLKVDIVGE